MNYNADQFYADLKKLSKKSTASKSKVAGFFSSGDVEEIAEEILNLAENNYPSLYEKKDSKGCIAQAQKEFMKYLEGSIKEASKIALKQLLVNWKEEGHI